MGQAGSRGRVNQGGRRVAALKRLQYKSDGVPSALKLLTRAVRLLHHLMKTIVADKISFQSRSLLVTSVDPLPGAKAASLSVLLTPTGRSMYTCMHWGYITHWTLACYEPASTSVHGVTR